MMTILLGAMATHLIERESETYLLSSMVMTKHFTAVQYYGRIFKMNFDPQMKTNSNKVRHIITLTTGQYDHLYNIMCSQDEIVDYPDNQLKHQQ